MAGVGMTALASANDTGMRLSGKGRAVFTVAGWNTALRNAAVAAGNWWIGNYGPLRWNRGYAVGQLGYRSGPAKKARMDRGEEPFYKTGDLKNGFMTRARTKATAKGGKVRFAVVFPAGWLTANPQRLASFRTVPAREHAAVAREFRKALIMALQTQRTVAAKKAQAKAAKQARAAENKAKRAAGKQRAADRRALSASKREARRLKTFKPAA
jgi:hypothetical protein